MRASNEGWGFRFFLASISKIAAKLLAGAFLVMTVNCAVQMAENTYNVTDVRHVRNITSFSSDQDFFYGANGLGNGALDSIRVVPSIYENATVHFSLVSLAQNNEITWSAPLCETDSLPSFSMKKMGAEQILVKMRFSPPNGETWCTICPGTNDARKMIFRELPKGVPSNEYDSFVFLYNTAEKKIVAIESPSAGWLNTSTGKMLSYEVNSPVSQLTEAGDEMARNTWRHLITEKDTLGNVCRRVELGGDITLLERAWLSEDGRIMITGVFRDALLINGELEYSGKKQTETFFAAALSKNGTPQWSRIVSPVQIWSDGGIASSSSMDNTISVAVTRWGHSNFMGKDGGLHELPYANGVLVIQIDSNGNLLGAGTLGSGGGWPLGLFSYPDGTLSLTMFVMEEWSFGQFKLPKSSVADIVFFPASNKKSLKR